MAFHDGADQWRVNIDSSPDPTFNDAYNGSANLADFLSRPVKIRTYQWEFGLGLEETFDPWRDFFSDNPHIDRKTDNFSLLSCKLNLKFVINGTPFHYGRLMASYEPWHEANNVDIKRPLEDVNNVHLSQRPHIYLNPSTSQGGCLCLPFIQVKNWIRANQGVAPFREMGQITISSLGRLRTASADSSDGVTVAVFAWATDVKLTVPTLLATGAVPLLDPQSDEYGQGVVSKPASAIAKATGLLEDLPIIGPFMKATSIAAGAVSKIAHIFGFSRPIIVDNQRYIKNLIMGNHANCDAHETALKLSIDSKQELCVDPRTVGLSGMEEMSFDYLKGRESYLTSFDWAIGDAPEVNLFTMAITPTLFKNSADGAYHMTPMGFVALPFKYWHGTIIVRFQVVMSQFHRGRLRLIYEPRSQLVSFNTDTYATNFNRIIDIQKECDFEMHISWAQDSPYIETFTIAGSTEADLYALGLNTLPAGTMNYSNGALCVRVLTELHTPGAEISDLRVNVFVRAGDDFEVAVPNEDNIRTMSYFPDNVGLLDPQGDELEASMDATDDVPTEPSSISPVGTVHSSVNHKNQVFFGEHINSFRTLLRRYNLHMAHTPPNWDANTNEILSWRITQKAFPYYRGYAPNGIHTTTGFIPYNYVNMTMLNYVTPAYMGKRGSTRYKMMVESRDIDESFYMCVERTATQEPYASTTVLLYEDGFSSSQAARTYANRVRSGHNGQMVTAAREQPGVEVEFPWYQNRRFAFAKDVDVNDPDRDHIWNDQSMRVNVHGVSKDEAGADTSALFCNQFVAAGEDYSLFFFLNVPQMYFYTSPAANPN